MTYSACATNPSPVPNAVRTRPPLPRRGRLELHAAVLSRVRAFLEREGCVVRSEGDADSVRSFAVVKHGAGLDELCDLQEALIRDLATSLHVDLLGGANVTRLDRIASQEHPRVTHREALGVLNRRGFGLYHDQDCDGEAATALTFWCGGLPVHVVGGPDRRTPVGSGCGGAVVASDYVLPHSGVCCEGAVCEKWDASPPHRTAGFHLHVERLLSFLVGLDRVRGVLTFPGGPAAVDGDDLLDVASA